jgi:hypothetical protein
VVANEGVENVDGRKKAIVGRVIGPGDLAFDALIGQPMPIGTATRSRMSLILSISGLAPAAAAVVLPAAGCSCLGMTSALSTSASRANGATPWDSSRGSTMSTAPADEERRPRGAVKRKTTITLKARRSRSACHGFGWLGGRPLFALVAGVRQRTRAQRPGIRNRRSMLE